MAKRYADALAEWVKTREGSRPRQDKHVVAFLAVRSDVKAAMDAGYALKTIWEHMHETGKIAYRYETFLKHVRRHIKAAEINKPVSTPSDRKQQENQTGQAKPADGQKPKGNNPPSLRGFKYEPIPKKEDLI
ncbi:MAG: TraK family protein [Gammaproteobacteria bacterium]|nr:TraK family protein [Gammaproteobacteria bacterium]MCP4981470.1 TraK family protein [Gammaproteobacteria bacterium]